MVMAAALILFVRKAAFNEERFPLAAQFPDACKALRAQAGEDIVKGEVHQARVVAVRTEDDAAAQIAPGAQYVPRGVRFVYGRVLTVVWRRGPVRMMRTASS